MPYPVAAKSNSIEAFPDTLKRVWALSPVAEPTADQVPLAVREFIELRILGLRVRQFIRMNFVPSDDSIVICFSLISFWASKGSAYFLAALSQDPLSTCGYKSIIFLQSEGRA